MKLNIAVLAGDGIGPEVIDQAVKVADAIATKFKHEINWKPALTGAAAIDAVGEPYPDETHEICVASDASYLVPLVIHDLTTILQPRFVQNKAY